MTRYRKFAGSRLLVGTLFALMIYSNVGAQDNEQTRRVKHPNRVPYQKTVFRNNCTSGIVCALTFPPVPPDKRLVITHVSLAATLESASVVFVEISDGPFAPAAKVTTIFGTQLTFLPAGYSANQEILQYFDEGAIPTVSLISNFTPFTGGGQFATLSGYLLDCDRSCPPIEPQ